MTLLTIRLESESLLDTGIKFYLQHTKVSLQQVDKESPIILKLCNLNCNKNCIMSKYLFTALTAGKVI